MDTNDQETQQKKGMTVSRQGNNLKSDCHWNNEDCNPQTIAILQVHVTTRNQSSSPAED